MCFLPLKSSHYPSWYPNFLASTRPDPSRPEVKNPYPSDPERDQGENLLKKQSLKMGDWMKYRIGYFCQIRGYYEVSSWCNFHNMQNNVMAPQL